MSAERNWIRLSALLAQIGLESVRSYLFDGQAINVVRALCRNMAGYMEVNQRLNREPNGRRQVYMSLGPAGAFFVRLT